jgi:hypothetical protein
MLALTGELLDNGPASGLLPQPFEHEGGSDAPHVGGDCGAVVDCVDHDGLGGKAYPGSQKPFQLPALAQILDTPERGDHLLTDLRAVAVAFNDLQISATAGGFLAEVHGRLISSQHMIASYTMLIKHNALERGTTYSRNPALDS